MHIRRPAPTPPRPRERPLDRTGIPVPGLALALLIAALFPIPAAMADWNDAVEALGRRDYAGAATEVESYLEHHPDFAPGHRLLGECRLVLGELALARRSLETAVDLNGSDFQSHSSLARIDLAQEAPDKAVERLDRFGLEGLDHEQKLTRARLLIDATRMHNSMKNHQRAYEAARLALASDGLPTKVRLEAQVLAAEAAMRKAETLLDGEPQAASEAQREVSRDWLEKSLGSTTPRAGDERGQPQAVARLFYLAGLANHHLGRTEPACDSYHREVELAPSLDGAERLTRCYASLGDWQAAKRSAEAGLARAVGADDTDDDSTRELRIAHARALHRLGEYDQAVVAYRMAGLDQDAEALEVALESQRSQEAAEARCAELVARARQRQADSGWQRGTPEWTLMMVEIEKTLDGCDRSELASQR